MKKLKSKLIFTILALFLSWGCASISTFDYYSYIETVSLKVDALALMDCAVHDVSEYENRISDFKLRIDKMYEYEKGKAANEITTAMWDIMRDSERHMIGGFIRRWQEEKTLRSVFIDEAKTLVSTGFDLIAELESGKIRPDEAGIIFQQVFF